MSIRHDPVFCIAAQVVGAPKCSIPICFADSSTIDQTAESLRLSWLSLPLFETERNSLPLSIPPAVIQASIAFLTQIGIATCAVDQ